MQWEFCFDTQQDLMHFLTIVHAVLERTGQLQEKNSDRFEHNFVRGDHIYRWEMIVCPPVIYPIQIHGIVLEAGRNCVVVADFGLTGYGKQVGRDFNHAEDRHQNKILAAFKKLRPSSEDQRLHILTLTDPMDIRKWTKAHYDEQQHRFTPVDKIEKLTKLLSKLGPSGSQHDTSDSHADDQSLGKGSSHHSKRGRGGEQQQPAQELPKSDPTEIVLARANFLLECGEDILPPYHVFYSNSECIAVWCKTGRWSTLQTAVFLSSTTVGGAKSATVATLGVAAAHAILAPVVAVGGLIYVAAPMVMLKKSREKWEESTQIMTEHFWSWAPPAVFVAAIEHWSALGYDKPEDDKDKDDTQEEE